LGKNDTSSLPREAEEQFIDKNSTFLSTKICPKEHTRVLAFQKGILSNEQLESCQKYLTICILWFCKYGFSALSEIIIKNRERVLIMAMKCKFA